MKRYSHCNRFFTDAKEFLSNLWLRYVLFLLLIGLVSFSIFGQKAKLPSKIGDGFVLEFTSPYNSITIDTDQKNLPNREFSDIVITPQTVFQNNKGTSITPETIRPGMAVEVKLDTTNFMQLTALQIKLRTNADDWRVDVDGYLDRVENAFAFVDGAKVVLPPNTVLVGTEGSLFVSLKKIPIGSLLDLKGVRQANGIILIKQGTVKPNIFTPLENELVEKLKRGLTVPPPGQTGAGVKIGERTYKVVDDLRITAFINTLGNRIVPRYLRNLPPEDRNKILFRFYVLEDDTPNAVALADGSVFIHTGMLKLLENEAQVAIVLGHEIAHVTNEHVRRRVQASVPLAWLSAIVGATTQKALGADSGKLANQLSFLILSNKFTGDMEDQADRVGLYYAHQAGYDIREAPKVWRRLMGNYNEAAAGEILYSNHPEMLKRLRDMCRLVVEHYANADLSESEVGRERFMESVGVYFGWQAPKPKSTVMPRQQPTVAPNLPAKTAKSIGRCLSADEAANLIRGLDKFQAGEPYFLTSGTTRFSLHDLPTIKRNYPIHYLFYQSGFVQLEYNGVHTFSTATAKGERLVEQYNGAVPLSSLALVSVNKISCVKGKAQVYITLSPQPTRLAVELLGSVVSRTKPFNTPIRTRVEAERTNAGWVMGTLNVTLN